MSFSTDSFAQITQLAPGQPAEADAAHALAESTVSILRGILDALHEHAPLPLRAEARALGEKGGAAERFRALAPGASPSMKTACAAITENDAGRMAIHPLYDVAAKRWQVLREHGSMTAPHCMDLMAETVFLMRTQAAALCHILGIDPARGHADGAHLYEFIRHVTAAADVLEARLTDPAMAGIGGGAQAMDRARARVRAHAVGVDCVMI